MESIIIGKKQSYFIIAAPIIVNQYWDVAYNTKYCQEHLTNLIEIIGNGLLYVKITEVKVLPGMGHIRSCLAHKW